MKEILTCKNCSKTWSRPKSRGRKPFLCPSCVTNDVSLSVIKISSFKPNLKSVISNPKQQVSSFKTQSLQNDKKPIESPSKWQCSSCLVYVTVEVPIYDPPTHSCKKRLKKIYPLEKVSKIIKPPSNLLEDQEQISPEI